VRSVKFKKDRTGAHVSQSRAGRGTGLIGGSVTWKNRYEGVAKSRNVCGVGICAPAEDETVFLGVGGQTGNFRAGRGWVGGRVQSVSDCGWEWDEGHVLGRRFLGGREDRVV